MEVAMQSGLWLQLLVIGIVLMLAEAVIPGFVVFPIGVGFILAAGVAVFTNNLYIIIPVFALFQVVSFYLVRKYMKDIFHNPRARTTAEGMIGAEATVTEAIAPGKAGYVKRYGDTWQARSYAEKELAPGTLVTITKVDGNKVWVQPLNEE